MTGWGPQGLNIKFLWNRTFHNPIITVSINVLNPAPSCYLTAVLFWRTHCLPGQLILFLFHVILWLFCTSCSSAVSQFDFSAPLMHPAMSTPQMTALQHLGSSPFALISFDMNSPGYHRPTYQIINCFSGLRKWLRCCTTNPLWPYLHLGLYSYSVIKCLWYLNCKIKYILPHFSNKIYSMPIKRILLINKHALEWKTKLNLHLLASNTGKFQNSKQTKFLSLAEDICIYIVFWKSFLQLNFQHKLDNWYHVHRAQTYVLLWGS